MKIKKTSVLPIIVAPCPGYAGGRFDAIGKEYEVPDKIGRQLCKGAHFVPATTARAFRPAPTETGGVS